MTTTPSAQADRTWQHARPPGPDGLRAALYGGALFHLPANAASRRLVEHARAVLVEQLGEAPREALRRCSPEDLFARLGRVRRSIYLDPAVHALVRDLIAAAGEDPDAFAFDPPRLRVVHPHGEREAAASAVYLVHRDVWYAHPSSVVTWWMALDDLPQEHTFTIWPDRFAEPVPNDSEVFDYDAWVAAGWSLKIGWQDRQAGLRARYPSFLGERSGLGPGVGFSCRAAEQVLFSGAHLHATRPHAGPLTRFSLDLRVAHLGDTARGLGAAFVDVRSRGSSLDDYIQPGRAWRPS